MSQPIYPTLGRYLSATDVPASLGPLQSGLSTLLNKLFVKKFSSFQSPSGDTGHYNVTLLTFRKVGVEIGGINGIALLLNPAPIPPSGTEITLSLDYHWPILRYARTAGMNTIPSTPHDFFQLALRIAGLKGVQFLKALIGFFYEKVGDPIAAFVEDYNSFANLNQLPIVVDGANPQLDRLQDILEQLDANAVDFYQYVFDYYINPTAQNLSAGQQEAKIEAFFKSLVGHFQVQDMAEMFVPEVTASLENIMIALEFPRNMLVPLDGADAPLPYPSTSKLEFQVGKLLWNSKLGFAFRNASAFNFAKSEIPGLGIKFAFTEAILDIWEGFNSSAANEDGRPASFKGIFIEALTIELPKFWRSNQNQVDTAQITGTKLLIGNPGGISGTIALENLPNQTSGLIHFLIPGAIEVAISAFDLSIHQNAITNSNIAGTLNFPGLQSNGNPTSFNFLVGMGADITTAAKKYVVEVQSPPSVTLGDIVVDFNHLKVGFDDNGIVPGDTAIDGSITFPTLTNGNGQPEQMGFALVINNPGGASTYTVTVTNPPTLKLFGVEVDFTQLQFTFNGNGIQNPTNISGNLYFPGVDDNNGQGVPMAFTFYVDNINKRYTLNVANVPVIYVMGIELDVNAFQIIFDDNGIYQAALSGTLLIPGTNDQNGSPQPINFALAINTGNGVKSFTVNAISLPTLHLDLFELTFNNIAFTFDETGILASNIAGNILIPGMAGPPIGFGLSIGNGTYSLSVANPPALTLGPVTLLFSNFTLAWNENGFITPFAISGTLEIEGLKDVNGNNQPIGFGFEIVNGTYKITASNIPTLHIGDFALTVQGFSIEFDKNGIIAGALAGYLEIEGFGDNSNDPAQIGMTIQINQNGFLVQADVQGVNTELLVPDVLRAEVFTAWVEKNLSVWKAGFSGQFDLLLSVPALDKILPETIYVDDFSIDTNGDTELNLRLKWNGADEITPDTGAGLNIYVPVNKTILEFITISGLELSATDMSPGLNLKSRLDHTTFKLGPVVAVVDGLGLEADITFPQNGGNIGPLQVDMQVIWPSGLGISIDAKAVKGGGYIGFDHANGRYYGALELTIKDLISVKAVGVLNTRKPDGSKIFSLLVLISAEFPPIQLGFGFTLNGVGGVIGIHRTMQLDALRQGVKSNSLDNILFPSNPVENIHQIISDIEGVFPTAHGRHSFGLMGIIGWGTPTLISIEMGLMIEVPEPVRIAILGVVKAILPDESKPLLKLQVNFLGTIDFEKKLLTFDASLFDSRLLNFTLAGDMAVRMKWGDNPAFLFTVGGFHPDFDPPPLALPSLQRLTVNLLGGNNPRLTLKAYFAVTSNTVQFGARTEFYFRVTEKIRVEGYLGFDALFQFSPFYFNIQLAASLAVYWKEKAMLSIYLKVLLEGPTPWHAQGKAEFTILEIKCKVDFDKRWGDNANTTLPDIAVLPKLKAALQADSAWQTIQPNNKVRGVTIRKSEPATGSLLAQPETILGINQKIVPLGVQISKFSNQKPSDHKHFDLRIFEGSNDLTGSPTKEFFAPNDFFVLSNSQKVSRPSFEQFNAGKKATLPGGEELTGDLFREKELVYDCLLMDSRNDPQPMTPQPESNARYNAMLRNGATARSANASKAKGKSVRAPKQVMVKGASFGVGRISTMGHYNNLTANTEMEARQMMREAILQNPDLENDLQVLPLFELA